MAKQPRSHRRERAVFQVGKGAINSLSWSPDGTFLALGDSGKGVAIVARNGSTLWRAEGHTATVTVVAWAPDGRRIASVSNDCTVRVWDALTGQELHRYEETGMNGRSLFGLAWAPDGRKLAWTRWNSLGTIRVYNADTWQAVLERTFPDQGSLNFLTWSADGKRLAVSGNSALRVLEADTLSDSWEVRSDELLLSWSPDSQCLATLPYFRAQSLTLWDAKTGAETGRADTRAGTGNVVCWSPNARVLATGGEDDDMVALWARDGLTGLGRLTGHAGGIRALAFAPTGGVLASGGSDGTIRLWDVLDLVPERPKDERAARIAAYLSLQARTVGRLPRSAAPVERWVPTGLPGAGSAPHCLGHLRPADGRFLDLFPDDRHFVTPTRDGRLVKWSLETGTALWSAQLPPSRNGSAISVSPNGGQVVVATGSAPVLVHDSATGVELGRGPSDGMGIDSVVWSPDGELLTAAGQHPEVLVWESATGVIRHTLSEHHTSVLSVAWFRDGRLITGGNDGVVRVWSIGSNRANLSWQSPPPGPGSTRVWCVAGSPDGVCVAVGFGGSGMIGVWSLDTGKLITECRGHDVAVYRVVWSPDGRLLASTSGDRTVRVWDSSTGAEIACFKHAGITGETDGLSWSSSGAFLVAGSTSGACVWDTRHLLAQAAPPTLGSVTVAIPLPSGLSGLPSALATLHRLSSHPPLSALRDALALAAGRSPLPDSALSELGEHPTVAKLRVLNWPEPACRGLAAYLLRDIPHPQTFAPPAELTATELPRALEGTLTDATDIPPEPTPISAGAVREALDALSDRALSVLRAIGHRAVATDPGSVARIVASVGRAPSAAPKIGRGLGRRSGGSALGSFGGAERAGASGRGDWRSVAPSQWALPVDVFAAKARRGEIMFRSARSARPDDRSPVVVVLDVSPGTWGPVGAAARAAAVSVLEARWRAGAGGWVVACGDEEERIWEVRSPGDWAAIWSVRSEVPGDGARALRAAERVRRCAGWGRVSVLVLSHVWFGVGVPRVGRVAAVLVRPPGGRGSGPRTWADRWVEVAPEPESAARAAEILLAELSV